METKDSRSYPSHFFQPLLVGFRRRLKIPVDFMKNHLNHVLISKKKKMGVYKNSNATANLSVILRNHNREWVVKLECKRYLGKGWSKFINQYFDCDDVHDDSKKMDVGDILVFKHMGDLVFDVSVFHPTTGLQKLPNHHSNARGHEQPQPNLINSSSNKKEKEKKKQFTISKSKPFFDSVIKLNTNILKKSMYVPLAFVKESGLENDSQVILKDVRGRKWEVDAKFYCRRPSSYVYLTKGWYDFHLGNGLKLGDCLRFRLVKKGQRPVILVTKLSKKVKMVKNEVSKKEVEEGEEST